MITVPKSLKNCLDTERADLFSKGQNQNQSVLTTGRNISAKSMEVFPEMQSPIRSCGNVISGPKDPYFFSPVISHSILAATIRKCKDPFSLHLRQNLSCRHNCSSCQIDALKAHNLTNQTCVITSISYCCYNYYSLVSQPLLSPYLKCAT